MGRSTGTSRRLSDLSTPSTGSELRFRRKDRQAYEVDQRNASFSIPSVHNFSQATLPRSQRTAWLLCRSSAEPVDRPAGMCVATARFLASCLGSQAIEALCPDAPPKWVGWVGRRTTGPPSLFRSACSVIVDRGVATAPEDEVQMRGGAWEEAKVVRSGIHNCNVVKVWNVV